LLPLIPTAHVDLDVHKLIRMMCDLGSPAIAQATSRVAELIQYIFSLLLLLQCEASKLRACRSEDGVAQAVDAFHRSLPFDWPTAAQAITVLEVGSDISCGI
jgi:hypothetical protein